MSNTFFHVGRKNCMGGLRPSWLRAWGKVVTARSPTRLAQLHSSFTSDPLPEEAGCETC